MCKKLLFVAIMLGLLVTPLWAVNEDMPAKAGDPVLMTNQLMLIFMDRMKAGDYKEAREVAQEMIYEHKKYKDSAKVEYKSFHSAMEKEYYEMQLAKQGEKKKVAWVEQPISDGFYLLAVLDFQEKKHKSALENLQKAIFWNPVRSAFYTERGFMLLQKDDGPDFLMAQIAYKKALELAETGEDFAAALRGLAFIFVERGRLAEALACLLVSKEFDSTSMDAEEELLFIRRADPDLFVSMNLSNAKELLRKAGIQTTYSPAHIQVLLRLADNFATGKTADKAIMLLRKAKDMAPENSEVTKRLQQLQKR
jgi:tetratricopeptide (TPR) repeat protein